MRGPGDLGRLGGGEEGGVGVGQSPAGHHPPHHSNLALAGLEVAIEVATPAQVFVHLAAVVHGDLGVVAHPRPLGVRGRRGERVKDSLVLFDVDQAEDAGAQQDGEDGEPVASLAVGGVDVT